LKVRGIRIGEISAHDQLQKWEELGINNGITSVQSRICEIYLQLRIEAQNDGDTRIFLTAFTMTLIAGFDFSTLKDAYLDINKHNADAAAFILRILQLSPERSSLHAQAHLHPACLHQLREEARSGSWKDFESGFKNVHDRRVLFQIR
jgi:hypothetical protein